MPRLSSASPIPSRVATCLILTAAFSVGNLFSATYDIRAVTGDKATSILGGVKQGSFGSPTLNDSGNIAYPCILFGSNVDAFSNSSIVYRKKGKKTKAAVAINSNTPLDNSFLPSYSEANTYGVVDSASVYKFGKAIAMNNKNQIGFVAEVLNRVRTDTYQDGALTGSSYRDDDRSDYGVVYPSATALGGFQNGALAIYLSYFSDILNRTLSISTTGGVPFNADIRVTPTRSVPGIIYSQSTVLTDGTFQNGEDTVSVQYLASFEGTLATTESNVIGLPYETTYASFSDAMIAKNNRLFIVADISDTGSEFDGLWQGTNPNLQPIVVKNSKAPGGGEFSSFEGKAGPNRKGSSVAFIANVTGGNATRSVFRSNLSGSKIDLIASVGDNAPGTGGTYSEFQLVSVNDRNAVAILGQYTESGTTHDAVWVSDPSGGNFKLIVRAGQTFNVNGKTKTITRIACNPIAALNKKGQIAFTASFTDKTSAVVIATP